ncbi:MAG: hypothetical protein KDC95_02955 [Planctomycetes bacterium]|nr:hypothetical protein [Planctomycetota bacterium]
MPGHQLCKLVVLGALVAPGAAQAVPRTIPAEVWTDIDRTLLGTSCVLRATVRANDPLDLVRAAERGGSYLRLKLEVHESLTVVDPDEPLPDRMTFFAAPESHPHGFHPTANDMRNHLGQERLFLLQRIGDRNFLTDRFRGTSIFPTDRAAALKLLVDEHQHSRTTPLPDNLPHAARLAELIDQLAQRRGRAALDAWNELQRLPLGVVPALVGYLDDDRGLGNQEFLLRRGGPQDLTISAHHPKKVGQAALLLLRHISGEAIGPREPEKANPEQLAQAASCWRVLAHRLLRLQVNDR